MNKGGRPLKWQSPEDLQVLVDKYFDETPMAQWTVTGLHLFLNATKQTLINYQTKEGYGDIIKQAKLKVEHAYEIALREHGRSGDIFALKNFGWKDKQEVDMSAEIQINVNYTE